MSKLYDYNIEASLIDDLKEAIKKNEHGLFSGEEIIEFLDRQKQIIKKEKYYL